jgi:two-component system sensor histidine kinase KdpD
MSEDRAQAFLQMIRRSQRGRLKVYLGYGPGVGKTYQMLTEAHRLKADGIDIVVGLVETHDRAETVKMAEGLETVPRKKTEYRGIIVEEMDLDAIISRNPQVVIVDELAHTNAPGSRNAKRYEDVADLRAAGIHVISAMNVQHLESLYNTVEQLVKVKVRERIPDSVLADADQVINIDLAADDLQKRLTDGKIYPRDRIAASMENFFTRSNLEHLRELTLRELAAQLDSKRREGSPGAGIAADAASAVPDQIMVGLSSRGPSTARLLRFASRLAGRINRNWYAVYVQTPKEDPTVIDAKTQRLLGDQLTLANQLGATVFTFKGQDVPDTILRFAAEYRVGQVVIGKPRPVPWWKRLLGERSVAEELIHRARGVTVVVADADADTDDPAPQQAAPVSQPMTDGIGQWVTEDRIVVWDEPVTQDDVRRRLVDAIVRSNAGLNAARIIDRLVAREAQGSTFLNEGVALPHARLEELSAPQVAMGLTHAGLLDVRTDKPIEVIFLLLTPADSARSHLQLLSKAGRALQDRDLRRRLREAEDPAAAVAAIRVHDSKSGV